MIQNSERISSLIYSFYSTGCGYEELKHKHENLINTYTESWISVVDSVPKDGDQVFAIQDLSTLGKGKFVNSYYYKACGFVAHEFDDDPYGFITHWIAFDTVNTV